MPQTRIETDSYIAVQLIEQKKSKRKHSVEQEYLEELKNVAACYGYAPESVDRLLDSGFSTPEQFVQGGVLPEHL